MNLHQSSTTMKTQCASTTTISSKSHSKCSQQRRELHHTTTALEVPSFPCINHCKRTQNPHETKLNHTCTFKPLCKPPQSSTPNVNMETLNILQPNLNFWERKRSATWQHLIAYSMHQNYSNYG